MQLFLRHALHLTIAVKIDVHVYRRSSFTAWCPHSIVMHDLVSTIATGMRIQHINHTLSGLYLSCMRLGVLLISCYRWHTLPLALCYLVYETVNTFKNVTV